MSKASPQPLDFDTPLANDEEPEAFEAPRETRSRLAEPGFGEEPELPPTWSEASHIFHTTEKCTRLHAIRRNRRITGNPGLRAHCLNCIDITSAKRRG